MAGKVLAEHNLYKQTNKQTNKSARKSARTKIDAKAASKAIVVAGSSSVWASNVFECGLHMFSFVDMCCKCHNMQK